MRYSSTLVLVILACLLIGCADYTASTAPTPTPTSQAAQVAATLAPTATTQPTVAPTARPTTKPTALLVKSTPTPQPTQAPRPTPVPTQPPPPRPTPTPVPHCTGVNGNPWCYDFNPGKLIYVPPADFCSYFKCIPTFVEPDDPGDGYIVECQDSTFSQSGGERGACSFHGGVMRALYSH